MAATAGTPPVQRETIDFDAIERPERAPRLVRIGERVPRVETLLVFAVAFAFFLVIGYRVTTGQHVVVFDAFDRLSRAYMVWWNDPPKLAAIGFLFPPFTTLVFLPFAVIKPLATSLVALPLTTALFAAGTLVWVDRLFARCEMPLVMRLVLLVVIAINPMFAFYAGNGMSEAIYLFMLGLALYCLVSWFMTREARYLIGGGIALSLALLTRYQFILWALLVAFLIGAGLVAQRRSRSEVEGSVIAYLAPVVYALTLWVLFNTVIVGDPIGWLTESTSGLAVNASGAADRGGTDVAEVSRRLVALLVAVAPIALVVGPALVATFVIQRSDIALWLAAFLALALVALGANALIQNDQGVIQLRDGLAILLTAIVGAAWLYYSLTPFRLPVFAATVALLVIGLFVSWSRMQSYPFQNLEQAFIRAVKTGEDQEGRPSKGCFRVGVLPERQMAAYIKRNVRRRDSILADNAQTFGVILLSGRPQLFFDRVDKGDTRWRQTLRNPYGKVQYMLAAPQASGDLVRRAYRQALGGANPSLTPVFRTSRYVLLRVARQRSATPAQTGAAAFGLVPPVAAPPAGTAGATGGTAP
jgi:hypothetical protein